jgi:hypothetical protein
MAEKHVTFVHGTPEQTQRLPSTIDACTVTQFAGAVVAALVHTVRPSRPLVCKETGKDGVTTYYHFGRSGQRRLARANVACEPVTEDDKLWLAFANKCTLTCTAAALALVELVVKGGLRLSLADGTYVRSMHVVGGTMRRDAATVLPRIAVVDDANGSDDKAQWDVDDYATMTHAVGPDGRPVVDGGAAHVVIVLRLTDGRQVVFDPTAAQYESQLFGERYAERPVKYRYVLYVTDGPVTGSPGDAASSSSFAVPHYLDAVIAETPSRYADRSMYLCGDARGDTPAFIALARNLADNICGTMVRWVLGQSVVARV